jgi:hypothetical protein
LERLRALALGADSQYRPFTRRRPGKAPRPIDNPKDEIKEVQRLIRRRFLAGEALDPSVKACVKACVKGGSPYKNAKVHSKQRNLARIDVKRCYPSITNTMAYRVLRSLGLGPEPARLLTRLCTRFGHLPQGAPTSDMLANLYLRP